MHPSTTLQSLLNAREKEGIDRLWQTRRSGRYSSCEKQENKDGVRIEDKGNVVGGGDVMNFCSTSKLCGALLT